MFIYLRAVDANQVAQSSLHVNENQECFPRNKRTRIILELSSVVIGVSTFVQKFGQEPPAVGAIIRLVSFLNKVKFNYVSCNYVYRMNLPSPKVKFPYFKATIKKKFLGTLL